MDKLCARGRGGHAEVSHFLVRIYLLLLIRDRCRHEYLGPDPRVAGYSVDANGDIHIRWWDAFLKDQWMDSEKWTLNVAMDASGKWIVRED